MPERVFVREKRQGLLDQVFQVQPRRTRTNPNFRPLNDEPPRRPTVALQPVYRVEQPRPTPGRRYSSDSDSDRYRSPVRDPRVNVWRADATLFQGLGRREPVYRAPTPPQETTLSEGGDSGRQVFTFVKKIGEGGQGRCDLYKRFSDKKLFVHKLMKYKVDAENGKPKEVKIMNDILGKHPRLIRLYFHDWSPTRTTLFFEYCAAGDLSDLVKAYHRDHGLKIPESFIWHVYRQLAEALAFMHTGYDRTNTKRPPFQAVIHRDIKPQNIFIRKPASSRGYPEIVLADFGLATTRSSTDSLCGSFLWQGPEVPIHSSAGDCWAVGACIHAMVTGSPPLKPAPAGVPVREWVVKPEARKVADLRLHGYSGHLDNAVYKVLRTVPSDRLIGRELVKRVERGEDDWRGPVIPLEPWALKN